MENIRRYPPAPEHLIRYSAVILGIIAALVIAFLAGSAIPAKATEPATDYAQLYQEALSRIGELEQAISDQDTRLEAKEAENAALAEQLAGKDEQLTAQAQQLAERETEITAVQDQLNHAQQENQRLIELYGTTYYVDYEVRHSGIFCPEGVTRHQTIVSAEVFNTLQIGDELSAATTFYSGPTGSDIIKWTAVIVDLDPDPTW